MSNTSQPLAIYIFNSSVEKKAPSSSASPARNPADLTSIAITSALPHTALYRNLTNDESSTHHTHFESHTGESKQGERTTRKECYRLGRRKLLFEQRRKASDYALFFCNDWLGINGARTRINNVESLWQGKEKQYN